MQDICPRLFFRLQLWVMKDTLSVCLKNKKKIKSVYNTRYLVCQVELRPSLARMGARKSLVVDEMEQGLEHLR